MKRCEKCSVVLPAAALFCGMCGRQLKAKRRTVRLPSKRLPLALGLAVVIFGGVYGLAASLNVSSGTLGAGNTSVAACQ
jgi:hypothetical protein